MSPLLPSWMYGDPADVAERVELTEIARVERERKRKHGLLGAGTVKLIKQMRIRALVAIAKRGGG
jgi:hypothetical protein